jgi:hypothetical protein
MKKPSALLKRTAILIVRGYQLLISPIFGRFGFFLSNPGCRFYPNCSTYAIQAVEKHGAGKGSIVALKRILRCHPFSQGGADPLK